MSASESVLLTQREFYKTVMKLVVFEALHYKAFFETVCD